LAIGYWLLAKIREWNEWYPVVWLSYVSLCCQSIDYDLLRRRPTM